MLILEAILNFRKARILRRLYKHGLLEAIRPWLTVKEGEESEALIRCTLEFLMEVWITKSLICNYEFGVGKAIVKVKKSGSADRSCAHIPTKGKSSVSILHISPPGPLP